MFKFTFTMLALFPFYSSDLCAAAYHNIVGTTIGAGGFFKGAGCWAAKIGVSKYSEKQQKKLKLQRSIRNNNNRNYNPYGY